MPYYIAKAGAAGESVLVVRSIRCGGLSIEPYRWFPSDRAPVHHFARIFKREATAAAALEKMHRVGGFDDFAIFPLT